MGALRSGRRAKGKLDDDFFWSISTTDVRLQSIIVVLTDHKVNNEILCFSTQICLVDSLVRNVTPFFLGGEQNRGRFVG